MTYERAFLIIPTFHSYHVPLPHLHNLLRPRRTVPSIARRHLGVRPSAGRLNVEAADALDVARLGGAAGPHVHRPDRVGHARDPRHLAERSNVMPCPPGQAGCLTYDDGTDSP